MSDFMRKMEEAFADNEGEAEQNYDQKMLDRLLAKLADPKIAKRLRQTAGDEYGFPWFNATQGCPIQLHASRIKQVNLAELMISSKMPKTKVWERYFDVKAEHDKSEAVGLIFRIPGCSNWILHNSTLIPPQRGQNMIVRPAADIDKQLTVCAYDAFLAGLKEIWGIDE